MKKKLAIALAVVMTAGIMTGCGDKADKQTPDTKESTETSQETVQETSDGSGEDSAETYVYLKDINVEDYLTLNGDYNGLTITVDPKEEVTQEQIASLALQAYNNSVTAELGGITDRAVALGDTINLDYSGKQDGVAFDGGTAAGQQLTIGSGSFIAGFEDGLIGVMPGETVDLNLTFPDSYRNNPDLAGAEVVFTVTVNFIYPSQREEMLDVVIETLTEGEYTTVDAFMDYCGEYLEYTAENNYQAAKESAVLTELENIAVFEDLPTELVSKYNVLVMNSITTEAAGYGVDADTFCSYYFGSDAATYAQQLAEASTRQGMLFQYVADKEGLNLSDEELDQKMQEFADENHVENVEDLLENATKEDYREYFMFKKVVDFICENAARQ